MSTALYNKIPHSKRPELRPVDSSLRLEVADNRLLHVDGITTISLKIGKQFFQWDILVAAIREEGLLGLDFLHHFNYNLNKNGLKLNGVKYETLIENVPLRAVRVTCAEDICLPPETECLIPGVASSDNMDYKIGQFCKSSVQTCTDEDIIIGNTIFDANRIKSGHSIPVRVINPLPVEVKIASGSTLGHIEEVNEDDIFKENVNQNCSKLKQTHTKFENLEVIISKWHKSVQDLYYRSCTNLTESEKQNLVNLLEDFKTIFSTGPTDLGRTNIVKHTIDTGNSKPIKIPPRRVPRAFAGEEEKIIQQQLDAGVIQKSKSPWSFPICFVRKRDGSTRAVVDYRLLNDKTVKDAYPLPRIDECLDSLDGSMYFSVCDLASGFWQIEVDEKDRPKTAFCTSRNGLYEYLTLPMGLSNSPSTFQRCMELIFRGLQWKILLIYLDDIICFGKSFDEHLGRLRDIFQRLNNANLKLKPSKCNLFKTSVEFLGFQVTNEGVSPTNEKVLAIQNWPVPKSLTEVRSYVQFCSYYRRFIKSFSTRAAPLNALMRAGQQFHWGEEQQKAFEDLKSALVGDEVMAYPNDQGLYILDVDASNTGIGGCLSQMQFCKVSQTEVEKPIMFASKSLTKTQRQYCVTRRELLAMVTFMHKFRHYLLGKQFLVRTDHSSLRWILSFKSPTDQMARWLELLAQFDFKIEHRQGSKHLNSDSLSRIPCRPGDCDCYDNNTVLENLPCKGCKICRKRHNEWSEFAQVDDVIPLFTRNITVSRNASGLKSPAAFVFLIFLVQQFLEFLTTGFNTVKKFSMGLRLVKYIANIHRLRIQERYSDLGTSGAEVSSKGVEEVAQAGKSFSMNDHDSDVSSCFKTSLLVDHSPESLSRLQREDPNVGCVIQWMESCQKPSRDKIAGESPAVRNLWLNWDILYLHGGILFRKLELKDGLTSEQIVLPGVLKREVIKSCHCHKLSAHLGIDKTVEKVKSKFWWYGLKFDVQTFIRNCTVCAARKRPPKPGKYNLTEYSVSFPLDRVCTDIIGPLPVTEKFENRYILVVMDQFTKFVECYPLQNQRAETVAKKIVYEYFSRYGLSLDLHSDQGSNYQSKLFQEICRLLEINQTRTSSFHPSANGMCERFNQSLYNMISAYINDNQSNWDEELLLVTSAYRSCVHSSTGYSPNKLMFGREVTLPIQLQYGCFPNSGEKMPCEYVEQLKTKLEKVYTLAISNTKLTVKRQKRNYDSRVNTNNFNIGDFVYCLDKTKTVGRSKKLEPIIWQGPFIVTRKLSDLLFEIKNQKKSKIVHHDKLKRYTANLLPDWILSFQENLQSKTVQSSTLVNQKGKLKNSNKKHKVSNNQKKCQMKQSDDISGYRRGTRVRKKTKFYQA